MDTYDAIANMDIDTLTEMFEAENYTRLRQWVISRTDQSQRRTEIEAATRQFLSLRDDAVRACIDWSEASSRYAFSPNESKNVAIAKLTRSIDSLVDHNYISLETRHLLMRRVQKGRIRNAQALVAELKWDPSDAEASASIAFEKRLQDPTTLLSELLEILQHNFTQLKNEADDTVSKLMKPLQDLHHRIEGDVGEIEREIESMAQQHEPEEESHKQKIKRYKDRLAELNRMKNLLSERTMQVLKTASIFREIAISIKSFIDIVRDQLKWIEKRSEYVSALSSLGESIEVMRETTGQTLATVSEELSSIKKTIGAKSNELHESMSKAIEAQGTINTILRSSGQHLQTELELSKVGTSTPLLRADFTKLTSILSEIRDL